MIDQYKPAEFLRHICHAEIKKPEIRNIPEIAVAPISFPEPAILGKERNLLPEARNPG